MDQFNYIVCFTKDWAIPEKVTQIAHICRGNSSGDTSTTSLSGLYGDITAGMRDVILDDEIEPSMPTITACSKNILLRTMRLACNRYREDGILHAKCGDLSTYGIVDMVEEINQPAVISMEERYGFDPAAYACLLNATLVPRPANAHDRWMQAFLWLCRKGI